MKAVTTLSALLLLLASGCGGATTSTDGSSAAAAAGSDSGAPTGVSSTAAIPSTATPVTTVAAPAAATGPDGCSHTAPHAAHRTYDAAPPSPLRPELAYHIELHTSCGTISIVLDQKLGGKVTASVAALVKDGFYDGLRFHRVVPQFVLQGGDPDGNGEGGPGYTVTQAPPATYVYRTGDVAMAKTAADPPGTAGSQFFVVSTPAGAEGLGSPPLYAVVGHATDPASVATIKRIDALGVGDGAPKQPVYILKAMLVPG